MRAKQGRGKLWENAGVGLHWANENPSDGFSTLASQRNRSRVCLPPKRNGCGCSSRSSSEPPPAEGPAGDQDWVSAAGQPIFQSSWRREGPLCALQSLSSPRGHSSPNRMPAQRLPEGPGNHVDANETSPPPLRAPTKRFHLTLFSRIDVSLPNPQTLDELSGSQSRSVKCHKQFAWAKTVVLTPCGFDYLIFFPPQKNWDLFCRERMKHENRPMVQLFCSNLMYWTLCNRRWQSRWGLDVVTTFSQLC